MRNVVLLQDRVHSIISDIVQKDGCFISSVSCDRAGAELFVLTNIGILFCFHVTDFTVAFRCSWSLNTEEDDNEWFDVNYVAGTGSIVCISHSGNISCIQDDLVTGHHTSTIEQIGSIDGGISTMKWNPDQNSLVIVTNSDTILLMSNCWDVLEEIPTSPRVPGSATSVSWRGDGEFFSVVSTDVDDSITRVRMYNRNLEVTATGRNIADGDASIMKGLGDVTAYATNGSYIAVAQQRIKGKHQVALVERNGLRHGDFDIRLPPLPAGFDEWQVAHLEWNLPSTLLAVSIRPISTKSDAEKPVSISSNIVQLYYRNNYYWYLKQQWEGDSLRFLGFDSEVVNRLYMSQVVQSGDGQVRSVPAVRIVDFTWDVCNSVDTPDSSTAVIDGSRLLLTPLGKNTVPPPMSMFVEQLQRSSRHASFWTAATTTNESPSAHSWGLSCLADDNETVDLLFGDAKGKTIYRRGFSLRTLLSPAQVDDLKLPNLILRAVLVTEESDSSSDGIVLNIVLLGSRVAVRHTSGPQNLTKDVLSSSSNDGVTQAEQDEADCVDELLVLKVIVSELSDVVTLQDYVLMHSVIGSVSRITNVPHDSSCIAIGVINHINSSFEVLKVSLQFDGRSDNGHSVDISLLSVETLVSLPENCNTLAIVTDSVSGARTRTASAESADQDSSHDVSPYMVLALSVRNRLYCNDTMIVAGASSFVFNSNFNLLMYITLGTRPHMHFSSFSQLQSLDPEMGISDELIIDCAEPRPVERGARLVCSVAGDSKVIIQLPRGNLELFEPRALILMRAQTLLDSHKLLECLVLLRRQRVDLNYIVDYKPTLFLEHVSDFVNAAFHANPDLLSLLVSSLEPHDVTITKYPRHVRSFANRNAVIVQDAQFVGDNKVNIVCQEMRKALLVLLEQGGHHSAINPVLCTFARQKPPLLVEALETIRATATRAAVNKSAVSLSTSSVQASIKYLAFLAEGNLLFEAALGSCDFDMARAVARQCQMDPKVYMPLLERFESIGKGHEEDSVSHALMHFKVNQHLSRYNAMIDWGVKLLQALLSNAALFSSTSECNEEEQTERVSLLSEVVTSTEALVSMIDKQDLFVYALPKLYNVVLTLAAFDASQVGPETILLRTLSDLRVRYGAKCVSKMNYSEAITAYLSATPPHAIEAIQAARQLGNWQYALTIAGRYCHEERYKSRQMEIDPRRIAQEIVSEFKENLEQGDAFAGTSTGSSAEHTAVDKNVSNNSNEDKVVEAARLSIEYCDDAEGAVSILTTAQRWMLAMQIAIKFNRKDLQEEIISAAKSVARDLLKTLPKKSAKLSALVSELKVIWSDPADRLQKVSTTDASLLEELQGGGSGNTDGHSDTASEYSAVTQQSTLSYRSDARSIRSGTSTLSILSDMSKQSAQSAATAMSNTPSTAFSIEGLDHSLLSRGKATKDPYYVEKGKRQYKRDQTERGQKRLEKSKTRGGRDVWGLRREVAICDELLTYAYVGNLANSVSDLCELLLLLGRSSDVQLASQLQTAMNLYVKHLTANPPPIGPMYPAEWLEKRSMTSIMRYQDVEAMHVHQQEQRRLNGDTRAVIAKSSVATWWKLATDGIKEWQTKCSVVYQVPISDA